MSEARYGALACPGCGGALVTIPEASTVPASDERGAAVSMCSVCFGVWFDWWAGEPGAIASVLGVLPRTTRTPRQGKRRCPRDDAALERRHYHDTGPSLLRCGQCLGMFVRRARLDELAAYWRNLPEPMGPIEDRSVWVRLWRLFR